VANLKAAAALKGDLMEDVLPPDPAPVVSVGPSVEASTVSVVVENSTSNDDEEADMDVEDDEVPAPPMDNTGEPARVPAEAAPSTGMSEKENRGRNFAALRGLKRKRDENEDDESSSDDLVEESGNLLALKVNPDGSVEQVDSVRHVEHFICLLHGANQLIGYGSPTTRSDTIGRSSALKPVMTSYERSEGARR
jgi:lipoprotein-anchoring transpeptidase ErfK/SrfK